jgi:DNA-binding transcriptional regulator YiaG
MSVSELTLAEHLQARQELPAPSRRREIRLAARVSQHLVARELGVTRAAVGYWETGRREPSGANLVRYASVLKMLEGASPP